MMRYFSSCCLLLIFSLPTGAAEDVRLKNIRVWAAPDNTRIVFDVSSPVEHDISLLSDPHRVVIDLKNTKSTVQLPQPKLDDKYVRDIRSGLHEGFLRVVLDLKKQASTNSFPLAPNDYHKHHRLVVDVYDEEQQQQAPIKETPPAPGARDVVIAIDAGHGGEDPGAIGPAGTHEKTVVLQIAKKLAQAINRERGMRAVLIRTGDYYLPLRKRFKMARRHKADLFISIHADAFTNRRVSGSSVYILSTRGASSEFARLLAEEENNSDRIAGESHDRSDRDLQYTLLDLYREGSLEHSDYAAEEVLKGLKKVGKVHKHRVESAGFVVLKSPYFPSLLIETAFISNPQEEKKLKSAAHQRKLAKAVTAGVKRYFENYPPVGTLFAARRQVIASRD